MSRQMMFHGNSKNNRTRVIGKQQMERMVENTWEVYLACSMLSLRDLYGFGSERIGKYIQKMNDFLDQYNQGYTSSHDMLMAAQEETGVKVTRTKDGIRVEFKTKK